MINTTQRIQTIAKSDLKSHTVKQLRKDVAQLIKTANRINAESSGSELNKGNIDYFLQDFHINTRGGFSANFNYQHRGKTELRNLYNQLSHYINADVDSSNASAREQVGAEKFISYVNGFDPEDENNITMEDAQEMFDLKSLMPELFDSQGWFYQDLPIATSKKRSELDKSVLSIALEEKKKLMRKNKLYTPQDLQKNIIKAIENAQNETRKREYTPVKKKDRKAARLSRKVKRR